MIVSALDSAKSSSKIEAQQLLLFQRHLSYLASASPYYRELFRQSGFNAENFRSWSDLSTLPLTGKKELTERNPDFLAVPQEDVIDVCQTSGITGAPVTIWQTEGDLQRLANNEQQAFMAAGIGATDRVLIGAALDRVFMAGLAFFLGFRPNGGAAIRGGAGGPALVAELIFQ
ncbi:MAG: phenylacetate--CoA ligase family protein, partial [Desulfuromusa sp.]|nr:phenylacetate--CoA ligase family protein [Desulfuromusa sp.]